MLEEFAFSGAGRGAQLLFASVSVLFLFISPWFAQKMLRRSKRAKKSQKRNLWIMGEALLASCLITSFVATAFSVLIGAGIIFPWLLDVDMENLKLDSPLTSRILMYWLGVVSMGWFVFKAVGLTSTRDVHRLVKEIQDDLLQCKKNETPPRPTDKISPQKKVGMWED